MSTLLARALLAGAAALLLPLAALAHPLASPAFTAHGASISGAGRAGDPAQVRRTVALALADSMRFLPAALAAGRGETLRIVARNEGRERHQIVLGTPAEIAQLRELVRRDPALAREAPSMTPLAPGASGQIVWQFDPPGTVEYACLQPGHYEAGMRGMIAVQ